MTKNAFNDEKIKAIIQRSINIVKDVEEPYRLKAFEVVLSKLWSSLEEKEKHKGEIPQKREETSLEIKIENFAKKCNVSTEQLKNVYDFEEEKPTFILARTLQGSHSERQVLVSRCLLAAYDEVYGKKWVSLRKVLDEHSIGSLQHLARNLERRLDIFRIRGKGKSTEYKLTDTAKSETLDMIRALATGQNQS
jgi:hypothetical protein